VADEVEQPHGDDDHVEQVPCEVLAPVVEEVGQAVARHAQRQLGGEDHHQHVLHDVVAEGVGVVRLEAQDRGVHDDQQGAHHLERRTLDERVGALPPPRLRDLLGYFLRAAAAAVGVLVGGEQLVGLPGHVRGRASAAPGRRAILIFASRL